MEYYHANYSVIPDKNGICRIGIQFFLKRIGASIPLSPDCLFLLQDVNQPYPHRGASEAAHALQLQVCYQNLGLHLLGIRLVLAMQVLKILTLAK